MGFRTITIHQCDASGLDILVVVVIGGPLMGARRLHKGGLCKPMYVRIWIA